MAKVEMRTAARAAVVVLIVAVAVSVRMNLSRVPDLIASVRAMGWLAPAAYVALYAVAVPLLVPGSLLTLAAGAVFGPWVGVPVAFCGAVAGSCIAFLVGRYVARPSIEAWAGRHPAFSAVDRAVADEGLRMVALLRLTPLVPFTILNYLLGLTRLPLRTMLLASPAMLPGTLLYVYSGHLIGDVASVAAGVRPPRAPAQYALLAVGLVAAALVAWRASVLARRALRQADVVPSGEA